MSGTGSASRSGSREETHERHEEAASSRGPRGRSGDHRRGLLRRRRDHRPEHGHRVDGAPSTGTESTAPESQAPAAPDRRAHHLARLLVRRRHRARRPERGPRQGRRARPANPDLNVTVLEVPFADLFNKYNADAATGGGPDLFIAPNDSLGFQAREGVIADLDAALAGKLDGKTETAVDGSKVDGKLFMVPESLKAVGLFYDSAKIPTAAGDHRCAAGRCQGRLDQGRLLRQQGRRLSQLRLVGGLRRRS